MADCSDPGKNEKIRETVRDAYSTIAGGGGSCCGPSSICNDTAAAHELAKEIGYEDKDLSELPDGANMGLSCGNPTALASLKPGEIVLDLGSGGGFDVFIAARKVGPSGRVIGIDMTPEMVSKARRNAMTFSEKTGLNNVEFRLGEIEHLPAADSSVDVIISNCVINLSPDKPQVWREAARVLKPGGRAAVSDLALLQPLPDAMQKSVSALVGCIAGAVLVEETQAMLNSAGFIDIVISKKTDYIDAVAEDWSTPLYQAIFETLPPGKKLGEYVTSLNISARKSD